MLQIDGTTRTEPAPTVHHAIDPAVGLEFLIEDWHEGLPWRLSSRPIGADGWQRWSPPVEVHEVPEVS